MAREYWVTRYAISNQSLSRMRLEETSDDKEYLSDRKGSWLLYKLGKDCFEDLADAVADAESRRDRKIKSLERQIAKLRLMDFKRASVKETA